MNTTLPGWVHTYLRFLLSSQVISFRFPLYSFFCSFSIFFHLFISTFCCFSMSFCSHLGRALRDGGLAGFWKAGGRDVYDPAAVCVTWSVRPATGLCCLGVDLGNLGWGSHPPVSSWPVLLTTSIFNSRFPRKVHRPTNQISWPKILFYVMHTSLDQVLRAQHTALLGVRSVSETRVLHSPSNFLQLLPSQPF